MISRKIVVSGLAIFFGASALLAASERLGVFQSPKLDMAKREQQSVSSGASSTVALSDQDSVPAIEIVSIGNIPAAAFRGTAEYEDDPMSLPDDTESRRSAFVFESYFGAPEILDRSDRILLAGLAHKKDGAGWMALTTDYSEVVPVLVVIDREGTSDARRSYDEPNIVEWMAVPVDRSKQISEIVFRGFSFGPGMTDSVPTFPCASVSVEQKSKAEWFAQCYITHRGRRLGLHVSGSRPESKPGEISLSYTQFSLDVEGAMVPIGTGTTLESVNDINRDGYPDFWLFIADEYRPGSNSLLVSQADGDRLSGYSAVKYVIPSCYLGRRERNLASLPSALNGLLTGSWPAGQ